MKSLLLVVDYQNDFVDGSLGFKKAQDIYQNVKSKILKYSTLFINLLQKQHLIILFSNP